jgi:mono/diheme cytochrome c family protein
MKKVFRIVGALVLLVVVAIAGFATFVAARGVPTYEAPKPAPITVARTEAQVLRGQKIASMLCVQCHSTPGQKLKGKLMPDLPAEFGEVWSANITQDQEHGIGRWTDEQIIHLLRTGVRPDGRYAVVMPQFANMADVDIQAVVAWLRSSDPVVQPDPTPTHVNNFNFLVKMLTNTVMKPLPAPSAPILIPDTTDQVAYGRYVADGLISCYACHSADFKSMNPLHPELSEGYYGGGNPMLNMQKQVVYSANLTPDEATGLAAHYTEANFVKAVRYGQRYDGTPLRYPMIPHSGLSDSEVKAIYAYLQTVPAIKNAVVVASNQ